MRVHQLCRKRRRYASAREAQHLDEVFELAQRLLVEGGKADVGGGDDAAELQGLLADAHAPDAELGRISGVFEQDIPELLPTEGSYNISPDPPPFKGIVTLDSSPRGL